MKAKQLLLTTQFGVAVTISRPRIAGILLLCFVLGFVFGRGGINIHESTSLKPWSWASPPVVINCYGEDLNELYITQGVNYWLTKGESVSFIETTYIPEACEQESLQGFIILRKAKPGQLKSSTLALTTRNFSGLKGLVSATIYFQPGAYRLENIIEHELGHAFGYTHVDLEGHIMHPSFDKMSGKFWIP
jgi:hypothetical protein